MTFQKKIQWRDTDTKTECLDGSMNKGKNREGQMRTKGKDQKENL